MSIPGIAFRQKSSAFAPQRARPNGRSEPRRLGSTEVRVESCAELVSTMATGIAARTVHATKMNSESSRSHLVVSLVIRTTNRRTGSEQVGKLTLVDLAGSERVDKSGAQGERLKEATAINKSLSALGDVISALTSPSGASHVPYRNHPLTMLMSDSLGGSAKTMMIVCASASKVHICDPGANVQVATEWVGETVTAVQTES